MPRSILLVTSGVMVATILYVLSIGPTHVLCYRGKVSFATRDSIYAPAGALTRRFDVLYRIDGRYKKWWLDATNTKHPWGGC
ncbi:MAG: hypothetical protein H0V44_17770 [Planctomycetes bacterium]|nr:hypothetical protein [Planctomycetota bacterium]